MCVAARAARDLGYSAVLVRGVRRVQGVVGRAWRCTVDVGGGEGTRERSGNGNGNGNGVRLIASHCVYDAGIHSHATHGERRDQAIRDQPAAQALAQAALRRRHVYARALYRAVHHALHPQQLPQQRRSHHIQVLEGILYVSSSPSSCCSPDAGRCHSLTHACPCPPATSEFFPPLVAKFERQVVLLPRPLRLTAMLELLLSCSSPNIKREPESAAAPRQAQQSAATAVSLR